VRGDRRQRLQTDQSSRGRGEETGGNSPSEKALTGGAGVHQRRTGKSARGSTIDAYTAVVKGEKERR